MGLIVLNINKAEVWEEVAKLTAYTSDKLPVGEDGGDPDRLLMTDEDQLTLDRFWVEVTSLVTGELREMLSGIPVTGEDYSVTLVVSDRYDERLNESVQTSLKSYIVSGITGRWFKLCGNEQWKQYEVESQTLMNDVRRKLYWRKRPTREVGAEMKTRCSGGVRSCHERFSTRLVFFRDELLHDIESYSFVTADIMPTEDDHIRHQVFDVAQSGNEELTTRVMNRAYAECVEALYPYTKSGCVADEILNDELIAPERYVIDMLLPTDFSRTTVVLLKELIHDYIVCKVLKEWYGITYREGQPFWKERLDELEIRMKHALLGRRKPLRRGQSMF